MNASENLMGFEFTIDANAVSMYSNGADDDGDEARFLGVAPSHVKATEIEMRFVSFSRLAVHRLQHHSQLMADGWTMMTVRGACTCILYSKIYNYFLSVVAEVMMRNC